MPTDPQDIYPTHALREASHPHRDLVGWKLTQRGERLSAIGHGLIVVGVILILIALLEMV